MESIWLHPGSATSQSLTGITSAISYPELFLGYVMLFIAFVLGIFANNAVAVNIAAIYTGRRPSVGGSLGAAFRHAGGLIQLILWGLLIAIGAYALLVVLGILGVFGIRAMVLSSGSSPWFAVIIIIIGACIVLAIIGLACLLALALTFAGYAIVIENRGVMQALASGFERIFNGREWGKALLIVIVAALIALGISMFSGLGYMLTFLAPGLQAAGAIWVTCLGIVSGVVQTVFYAVYYYDVRIRREGYDLEAALARLASPAP